MSKHFFYILVFFIPFFATPIFSQSTDSLEAQKLFKEGLAFLDDRELDKAILSLNKASTLFKASGQIENWAKSRRFLYQSYGIKGKYDRASEVVEHALQESIDILGEDNGEINMLILAKGNLLYYQGEFQSAIDLIQNQLPKILELFGTDSNQAGLAFTILATAYQRRGNLDKSLLYARKNLQSKENRLGTNHLTTAAAYEILGNIYMRLKQTEEAVVNHEMAKEIRLNILEDSLHLRLNHSYSNLGICYAQLGDYPKAEKYFLLGLQTKEALYGVQHPNYLIHLWNMGSFYNKNGRYEKGLQFFQKELSIRNETQFSLVDKAENFFRIAYTYGKLEKNELALESLTNAFEIIALGFIAGEPLYSNPKAAQIKVKTLAIKYADLKLQVLYQSLQANPDNPEAVQSAMELGELTFQLWDKLRAEIVGEDRSKKLHSQEAQSAIEYSALVAGLYFQFSQDSTYAQRAFQFSEKSKALLLHDAFVMAGASLSNALPKELQDQEKLYQQKLADYESQVFDGITSGNQELVATIQNDSIFPVQRSYNRFLQQLREKYADYYQLNYQSISEEPLDLGASLGEEELFIQYLIRKEINQAQVYVQEKGKPLSLYQFELPENTASKIEKLSLLLKSFQLSRNDRKRAFVAQSHDLYQTFLAPIEKHFSGKKKLIISADDYLHYVPFEAMLRSDSIGAYTDLDFLVKRFEISYQYSGSDWLKLKGTDQTYAQDLIAFAPVFEQQDQIDLAAFRTITADTTFRALDRNGRFRALPYTAYEVEAISALFRSKGENTNQLLLKAEATESNLKYHLGLGARFIHLATHSFSNLEQPEMAGIACYSSGDQPEGSSNILFSGEIYNLQVNCDLLVLSSCESGLGQIISGEGMFGINRSFVQAGAKNVVFSLWKIYDQIGSDMMLQFYEAIFDGKSYSEALHYTKVEMLKNPKTASPEFWAAFLLLGQ